MLLLLLVFTVLFMLLNYRITKRDMLSPATISCASLLIGISFSYFGADSWNFQLSFQTFSIIIIGFFVITLANGLVQKRLKVPESWRKSADVSYSDKMIFLATFVSLICTLLYGINAYRVGMMAGGSGKNAFAYMKMIYIDDTDASRMNPLIRQLFKPVLAIAYVHMYLFIESVIRKTHNRRRKVCGIVSILSAVMIVIFSGSRTEIMRLLSAGLLMFSILWRESSGWKVRDNKRSFTEMIKKIWPYIFAFLVLAFVSRNVVKTESNALSATSTFFQYIIYYVGSSVAVLNRKMEMVYSDGGILFGNEAAKSIMHAQVYLGNLNYGGNTATIFITIFNGGVVYMLIRLFVIFLFGTLLYRSLLIGTQSSYKRNRNLIIFSTIYYVFTMAYYSDCVGLITKFSNIMTLILVILYHKMITRVTI